VRARGDVFRRQRIAGGLRRGRGLFGNDHRMGLDIVRVVHIVFEVYAEGVVGEIRCVESRRVAEFVRGRPDGGFGWAAGGAAGCRGSSWHGGDCAGVPA
jgi:hypothetical protein